MIIGLIIAAVVVYGVLGARPPAHAAAVSGASTSTGTPYAAARTWAFRCLVAFASGTGSDGPEGIPARERPGLGCPIGHSGQ